MQMIHLYPGSLLTFSFKSPWKTSPQSSSTEILYPGLYLTQSVASGSGFYLMPHPLPHLMGNPPGWSDDSIGFSDRLQITDYRLQITNYKLQITNYKLQITDYRLQIMDYGVECGMSSTDVCSKITSCTQYHSIHYITSCTLFKCPFHCTAHGYCAGHNKVFSNHKTFMVYLGFRLPKWAVITVKSCTSLLCFALV